MPSTGITDYAAVCEKYAELITGKGAKLFARLPRRRSSARRTEWGSKLQGPFWANLINCAGLYSDRICQMAGDDPGVMIVPFRGEYYDLVPERAFLSSADLSRGRSPVSRFSACILRGV